MKSINPRKKKLKHTEIIDIANAPERSDEELFSTFIETSDNEILGHLFRKHMPLVFGVCMKYVGEKSAAQDACMEVFERLMSNPVKSEVKNFRAYLFVMSRNHCLMKQRGEKVIHVPISESDMESAMETHPIDSTEQNEKLLAKCLKELKDAQKLCVEQFYLGKKSYLEISKELSITLNAVKSNIQNGKRNLKTCMESIA